MAGILDGMVRLVLLAHHGPESFDSAQDSALSEAERAEQAPAVGGGASWFDSLRSLTTILSEATGRVEGSKGILPNKVCFAKFIMGSAHQLIHFPKENVFDCHHQAPPLERGEEANV